MTKKNKLIPSDNTGFMQDLVTRIKLILRLLSDRRVNFFLKLLPIASLVYLISPVDLVPGLALPVIGALDDAAVLWIGTSLFLNLVPEEIVEHHLSAMQKVIQGKWRDVQEEEIVEVEAHDVDQS
ncbi:MAG: YkvA family protein [Chloroflexota bacterium]